MNSTDVELLENAINRIRQDWESRNIGGEQDILAIFNEESEQRRVAGMFKRWHEATNIENTGTLDAAIQQRETEKISRILEEFLPVSQEFLALASDKFAELVSK